MVISNYQPTTWLVIGAPPRLTPPLQKALLNTLRRGVKNAAAASAAGVLEERAQDS